MFESPTADRALDRITALAAMLFDAPMSGVYVGGRLASVQGAPLGELVGGANVTVNHALMSEAPYAHFRASVALCGPEGEHVGSLYVADTRVRPVSERELKGLRDLAAMALNELMQRRAAAISTTAPQMVFVLDAQSGRVTYLNDDAANYAVGRLPLVLGSVHPEDRVEVEIARAQLRSFDARCEVTVRVKPADCSWRWLNVKLRVTRCDASGLPLDITGVVNDVTEAKELQEELTRTRDQLAQLVTTDEITQVSNKRGLNQRLSMLSAEGERGRRFAVCMVDIDHFKKLNDTYGHASGDRVLRDVAQTLQASVRKTDFVARYGGEEFCVVFTDVDGPGALALAERLRLAVSQMSGITVTASFGVAVCSSPERANAQALLESADQALYRAKHAGRNRVAMARRTLTVTSARKPQRVAA